MNKLRLRTNERGEASTFALLLCAVSLALYLKVFRDSVLESFPPSIDLLALIALGICSLFAVGCFIHMKFVGEPGLKAYRKELHRSSRSLNELANKTRHQVDKLEMHQLAESITMSPIGTNALDAAQRILAALEQKNERVKLLLERNRMPDMQEAHALLSHDLELDDHAYQQLIQTDPIPPIKAEDLVPTLSELFQTIDEDFERFARKQESMRRQEAKAKQGYNPTSVMGDEVSFE